MNYKKVILIAGILGILAVILGAFGAHALEDKLTTDQLASYGTANDYQFYHALLLVAIGLILKSEQSKLLMWSAYSAITGIILFSGSIYLLACKDIIGISNTGIIGPITPLGGLFFILSWLFLLLHFIKKA
jgi:uncharacterized membrane protein YgdD (TMEM256/DUF423 family)